MKRVLRWLVEMALPPAAFFVLFVALWQATTYVFDIGEYLVPSPRQVLDAAHEHQEALLSATRLTGSGALCGFALSLLVGTALGLIFSQSRWIARCVYPYAIFLQTVPIVAIAPVLILWLGNGFRGVVSVSFIISLFPVITNATAGLTTVDPSLLELFEIHSASRWQLLWKLRLPGAIASLVTAAKISCGLSVIGAIVGEMAAGFSDNQFGLGYLITAATGKLDSAYATAAVLCSTLLSIAIFATVSWLGAVILARWHLTGRRATTAGRAS